MILDYDRGIKDTIIFPTKVRIVYNEDTIHLAKMINSTAFDENKRNIWENTSNIYIQRLKTLMDTEGKNMSKEMMGNAPIHIGRAWTQLNHIGIHHHAYALLTGVFYVTIPENSGDLILIDPRGSVIEYDIYNTKEAISSSSARFIPRQGALIFFPGYVLHYSEKNQTNEKRRCIAANFFRDQHPEVKERILPDEEYSSN